MQLMRALAILALLFAAAPALADPAKSPAPPSVKAPPSQSDADRIGPAFVRHLLDRLTEDDRMIALLSAKLDVALADLAAAKKAAAK